MKELNTIQPVSNLQNYNQNIAPVLRSGKSVNLTKSGRNYWVVMTNKQANNLENKGANKMLGILLKKELDAGTKQGNKKHNLTPDEFIKRLQMND